MVGSISFCVRVLDGDLFFFRGYSDFKIDPYLFGAVKIRNSLSLVITCVQQRRVVATFNFCCFRVQHTQFISHPRRVSQQLHRCRLKFPGVSGYSERVFAPVAVQNRRAVHVYNVLLVLAHTLAYDVWKLVSLHMKPKRYIPWYHNWQ